ncbi:Solute carrier organic anion transporter family member 4C1, partial [Stegodyphus mimosarum]
MSERNVKADCEALLEEETKLESPGETKQDDLTGVITTDRDEARRSHSEFDFGDVKEEISGDPRDSLHLESLREYSDRIKAFLGWDSNSGESVTDKPPDEDLEKNDCLESRDFPSSKSNSPIQSKTDLKDVTYSEVNGELDDSPKTVEGKSKNTAPCCDEIPPNEHCKRSTESLHSSEETQELFETNSAGIAVDPDSEFSPEKETSRIEVDILGNISQRPIMNETLLQDTKTPENGLILKSSADLLADEEGCNNNTDICNKNNIPETLLNDILDQELDEVNSLPERITKDKAALSTDQKDEQKDEKLEERDSDAEGKVSSNINEVRKLSVGIVKDVLEEAATQLQCGLSDENIEHFVKNDLPLNEGNSEISRNSMADADARKLKPIEERPEDFKEAELQTSEQQLSNGKEEKYPEPHFDENETKLNNEMELKNAAEYPQSDNISVPPTQLKDQVFNDIAETQESDEDTVCGIGIFRPKWIQKWATPEVYLVLYSIIGVLQGTYYTYLVSTITTLEKRFAFKTKISGTIMLADEISPLLLGPLVGYFGGKFHRPRIVAIGMLLSALCCFVSALPYFIYGTAQHLTSITVHNKTGPELCNSEIKEESCESDDRPPTMAAVLFLFLGSFLKGFGNLAYYAVGLTYMDDNTKKKNSPVFFAIAFSFRLLGPFCGSLIASACLKYYENPFADPGYGPDDPRWIGAWWLGFVLQGIVLAIFTLPLFLFPRRLPGHKASVQTYTECESFLSMIKGMFAAFKRLGKNPLYLFHALHVIFALFGNFGHWTMLPKYMENQFRLTASEASLYAAPPALGAIMVGIIFGGILVWKFKPSVKTLTIAMVMTEVVATVGYLLLMIPKCQEVDIFNTGFNEKGFILENTCNYNCNCSTREFSPICASDGKTTFFSPCYAGCSLPKNDDKVYANCSCGHDLSATYSGVFTEGYCPDEDCWSQALYYIIFFPTYQGLLSIVHVAHTLVTLRCVHPEDKSTALGVKEALISLFCFIPYPIVFGAIVDSTCLIWEESCGQSGNCWFYNMETLNYLLHGVAALSTFCGAICTYIVYRLRGRLYDLYEDDDKSTKKNEELSVKLDTVSNTVTRL